MVQNSHEELAFTGKVLDNVHGFIWYTKAEEKIIDTLLFKRLQTIKQLSLVNWVFPGSEHTRFIHSLGVMHIIDQMAIALGLSINDRKIARLAGLLHDIGHYPLSHVCEFPYKKKIESFSETDFCADWNKYAVDKIRSYEFDSIVEFMKAAQSGHHEEIGALIIQGSDYIKEIITAECGSKAVDTICDMITGNIRDDSHDELLVQLLHSELDADGIDYMLRDAVFSGTSFGSFELDQLISTLHYTEFNKRKILCIKPKGIAAADQYLINKFFSYSQVVYNKHTSIIEWMAEQIVLWMQEKDAYFPDRDTLRREWVTEKGYTHFLSFNDDYFWHSLRNIIDNPAHKALPKHIVSLCKALLDHRECKYIEGSELKFNAVDGADFRIATDEQHLTVKEDEVIIFSESRMTKHIPLKEFKSKIKKPYIDELSNVTMTTNELEVDSSIADEFNTDQLSRRLLEGICVCDDNGDVHLLCDDHRSLMQHLYKVRSLIVRKYTMVD